MTIDFRRDSMMMEHSMADSNSSIRFSYSGRTKCSSSASLSDSNGSNTSSGCANYLHDDLIIEVLSRLPDKTLVKFMCVSKSWRNLISNSLPPNPMTGLLLTLFNRKNKNISDMFIDLGCSTGNCLEALQSCCASLRTSHPNITVTHHCNGLFLLSDDRAFYVCNHATNQCVALLEPLPLPDLSVKYSALAFDPRKSSHYKVIRISGPRNQVEGQIYSSDKNQWVSFSAYFQKHTCGSSYILDYQKRLVYFNGALHFICVSGLCMISFYVEEKLFREFKVPSRAAFKFHWLLDQCLGESEGNLYYAACYSDKFRIWMLQSFDTGKWLKKHTIRVANFGKAISPSVSFNFSKIIAFHKNLEVLFIRHEGVIFSYYFGSAMKDIDRLKEVCSIGEDECIDFVSPYSRCLVSLKDVCNRRS